MTRLLGGEQGRRPARPRLIAQAFGTSSWLILPPARSHPLSRSQVRAGTTGGGPSSTWASRAGPVAQSFTDVHRAEYRLIDSDDPTAVFAYGITFPVFIDSLSAGESSQFVFIPRTIVVGHELFELFARRHVVVVLDEASRRSERTRAPRRHRFSAFFI